MNQNESLTERLRNRIVGALHAGHLHAGDRLPSYREVSGEWEVDHRAVARAYRNLEVEGLTEIRGRSGVYLAAQEKLGGELLPETARWLAEEVLVEAWRRGISIPKLPEFVRRCTASVRLRCACIDSTEDHRTVLCAEVEERFGFECAPVPLDRLPEAIPEAGATVGRIPREVRSADLLVTTTFHAGRVRALAEAMGKHVAVVSVHPLVVEEVERRLREGPLSVVCVDPRFGERVRSIHGGDADRIRVVRADDAAAVAALDPAEPVLATLAAHRQLGELRPPLLVPHLPAISPESALELSRLLIRLNIEANQKSE